MVRRIRAVLGVAIVASLIGAASLAAPEAAVSEPRAVSRTADAAVAWVEVRPGNPMVHLDNVLRWRIAEWGAAEQQHQAELEQARLVAERANLARMRANLARPAPAPTAPSAPAAVAVPAGGNRGLGQQMAAAVGWVGQQWVCLDSLWTRESGWNHLLYNRSGSGAYGIPQALPGSKMASHGADWRTNPATQIAWGLDYVAGRYGSPCGALAHFNARGWY